ncbi:MAG TPA: NAD(P)-dependent oxidoreductase [Anaeromyxobacteraceae bacterium]|nr:NAD(P)-dependent oxidoreductase [Anaeromyxobacteraceae bacterium]
MTEARRAVVTGATGFVGSRLCRALVAAGWEVHLVARPGSSLDALGDTARAVASIHRHDGTTPSLVSWFEEVRPDVTFHLASLFVAEHTVDQVAPLVEGNVLFGAQVAEAMSRSGLDRLVNAGTSWQHFGDSDYDPVCLYAATKQAFEDLLEYYVRARALRVVTLKLFDTYGPGDPRPKLFRLLREAAASRAPLLMSGGEQRIDLVHVDDAVAAFRLAAARLLHGDAKGHERYAVSSGNPIRLRDLVELYARVAGTPLAIDWGKRPYRAREVMTPWTRGVPLPGWAPEIALEDGLRLLTGAGGASEPR